MIRAYLRNAVRQLLRSKAYSLINIVGLSAGLAACFIILVYVSYQMSFDRHNERLQNILLITTEKPLFGWTEPRTPFVLGPAAKAELPGVQEIARWTRLRSSVRLGEKAFEERGAIYSDPEIFRILTLPLLEGNVPEGTGDYLVISEKIARKYFGDRSPIGQVLSFNCAGEPYEFTVTAVMKDIPRTSTFSADFIGPLRVARAFGSGLARRYGIPDPALSWTQQSVIAYCLVHPLTSPAEFQAQLAAFAKRHEDPSEKITYGSFPVKDIYFHSAFMMNNPFPQGDPSLVSIYAATAVLLLVTACANYLLLSLGRASVRTREIGMRKVLGARKRDLVFQITVEAVVVTLLCLPLALAFTELFLQQLTGLLGTTIERSYSHGWSFLLGFGLITLAVGILAGSYSAVYLAGFTPVEILQKKTFAGPRKLLLRRVLMGTQMVIFLGLTLAALVIYRQLLHCERVDTGFAKDRLLVFEVSADGVNFPALKAELLATPGVLAVSGATMAPGTESRAVAKAGRKGHPEEPVTFESIGVDRDFIEAMGMHMVSGTSFAGGPSGAPSAGCILNESAVREFGLPQGALGEYEGMNVIGVVKDFNMHSLRERIPPIVIRQDTKFLREIVVRIAGGNVTGTAQSIDATVQKLTGSRPVELQTFDERIEGLYEEERKFATVMVAAAGITVIVACLGILGMALFVCQQRVKEVGIRKVLGASVRDVYTRLTQEFVLLIGCSAVLGFPLAMYLVNHWLENFAYRIQISAWDLVGALTLDILVVLAAVSYQALRAARANPVESLRYE